MDYTRLIPAFIYVAVKPTDSKIELPWPSLWHLPFEFHARAVPAFSETTTTRCWLQLNIPYWVNAIGEGCPNVIHRGIFQEVLYYSGFVSHFSGFALPNLRTSQVEYTTADSYCIHYLKLTASIVPRQLAYCCNVTYFQRQLKGAAVREQLSWSVEGSSYGQQEDQSIHNLLTKFVSENCLIQCTMAVLIL